MYWYLSVKNILSLWTFITSYLVYFVCFEQLYLKNTILFSKRTLLKLWSKSSKIAEIQILLSFCQKRMFDLIGNETVSESQKFDQLKIHGFFPKSSICMFFICQNHLWRAIPSYMVSSLSLLAQNLVLVPIYLLSLTFTVDLRPKIRWLLTKIAQQNTKKTASLSKSQVDISHTIQLV